MAKTDKTPKKAGRPKSANPKNVFIGLRLDATLSDAVDSYRKRNHLEDLSSAVRHMMRRILESDGILDSSTD